MYFYWYFKVCTQGLSDGMSNEAIISNSQLIGSPSVGNPENARSESDYIDLYWEVCRDIVNA